MYIAAICLEWQNQIRFSALLILKKQTFNVSLAQGNSFFEQSFHQNQMILLKFSQV
ncbi:hypothetical protein LEP1GSC059_3285 [Leptospira noguchii serovar Panama str. CZ214]|uniref:Uncharacterized protein n=1 Tax=Leptospira noguchii serovar Panama str. CZ214 TaxID=1001595 RepID=T0FTJ8_9LEPT|nr:hypothetical protein LEP1GSC059_3285 [Leptospira noguchii serovar Panama str. CZ214]